MLVLGFIDEFFIYNFYMKFCDVCIYMFYVGVRKLMNSFSFYRCSCFFLELSFGYSFLIFWICDKNILCRGCYI